MMSTFRPAAVTSRVTDTGAPGACFMELVSPSGMMRRASAAAAGASTWCPAALAPRSCAATPRVTQAVAEHERHGKNRDEIAQAGSPATRSRGGDDRRGLSRHGEEMTGPPAQAHRQEQGQVLHRRTQGPAAGWCRRSWISARIIERLSRPHASISVNAARASSGSAGLSGEAVAWWPFLGRRDAVQAASGAGPPGPGSRLPAAPAAWRISSPLPASATRGASAAETGSRA
jgi:hypothetical protein